MASSFNPVPLLEFLCAQYNVKDPSQISFFGPDRTDGWRLMKEVNTRVEFHVENVHVQTGEYEREKIPCVVGDPQRFRLLSKAALDTTSTVCIYNVMFREYTFKTPNPSLQLGVRLTFFHAPMAEREGLYKQDEILKAGGQVPGLIATHDPAPNGQDIHLTPLPELCFSYLNAPFTKTMGLLTETNLQAGLVRIPPEVCTAAGLRVRAPDERQGDLNPDAITALLGSLKLTPGTPEAQSAIEDYTEMSQRAFEDAMKDHEPITCYYAIPPNHILAWPYRSERFCFERRIHVKQLRVPSQGILCYLLDDVQMKSALESARSVWVGKVDRRPLREVGIEVLPFGTGFIEQYALRGQLKYFTGPVMSQDQLDRLIAPTLSPDYPPADAWCL